MATDLSALKAAIKLLVDAGKDVQSGASVVSYANLFPDIIALVPSIGDIPAEAKALEPADYVELVGALASDLSVTDAHSAAIISASVALLNVLVMSALPAVEALLAAIKAPAAA